MVHGTAKNSQRPAFHSSTSVCHARVTPKFPWSSLRLESLKRDCSRAMRVYASHNSIHARYLYNRSRRLLQSETRKAKRDFFDKQVCDTIAEASCHGVKGLYKTARKRTGGPSSNVSLSDWKSFSSNLYQSFESGEEMVQIPTASSEKCHNVLLSPFSVVEIASAINNQKSNKPNLLSFSCRTPKRKTS